LSVDEQNTATLAARHLSLDVEIGAAPDHCCHLVVQMKKDKCAIRTEIARRVLAGDPAAIEYARQRQWGVARRIH